MNTRVQTQVRATLTPSFTPVPGARLQRQCACGTHTMGGGQCAECQKKQVNGKPLQTNLAISEPGDAYEQEADRVAEQVMLMSGPEMRAKQNGTMSPSLVQRRATGGTSGFGEAPPIVQEVLNSPGQPLDPATRAFFEPRFGHDFSHVRVHTGSNAATSALGVKALAYCVGGDIVFSPGRYAPRTYEGQRLMAHELVHVAQQRGQSQLLRQVIPQELRSNANVRGMKPDELQARYDSIVQTMKQFTASTPDYRELEAEMQSIANELARREALKAGRTFGDTEVTKMKEYFVNNATSAAPKSCIACMNAAMRILLVDSKQRVGSEVEKTMAKLQQSGHAGDARVIEFEDTKGRITYGTLYPDKLHESVWEAVKQLAGGDVGWSVFGMSVMDGNHSVTLTLDNNNPLRPTVYWSDQWSSKGGWKAYDMAELDAEVTRITQGWWNKQPENRKFNTRLRLWRLNP